VGNNPRSRNTGFIDVTHQQKRFDIPLFAFHRSISGVTWMLAIKKLTLLTKPVKLSTMPVNNPSLKTKIEFRGEVDTQSIGMSPAGIQKIVRVFEDQIERGLHPGAQLVVLRKGQVVLDRASGVADRGRKLLVERNTPFLVFSISKSFTAMCIHQLAEQGRLDLDAPVAKYWPEFGCAGKETATIRHVLTHQAGIPIRGLFKQFPLWTDWEKVTDNVANSSAEYPPGTKSAYHLVNFGFILGEVVRRVANEPLENYLERNLLLPLSLEHTALGLPDGWLEKSAGVYCGHPEQLAAALVFRSIQIRRAVIPAATLHSTARDLAVFFQMLLNGGEYAGNQYFKPETIEAATQLVFEGIDSTVGNFMRWGMGFMLGGPKPAGIEDVESMGKNSTTRTFGHAGQGTCIVWADPDAELVLAFTCNRMLSSLSSRRRCQALADATWEALA
jgi:CubicO group peptidase (beta-lactamase class C family)